MDLKSLVPWRNNKTNLPATREDYFDPFVTFRREMDRMFEDFFTGLGSGRALQDAKGWTAATPMIDVAETDKDVVITAELPGLQIRMRCGVGFEARGRNCSIAAFCASLTI